MAVPRHPRGTPLALHFPVMNGAILVVDDDPAVLKSYGRVLGKLGHDIRLADDSEHVLNDPASLEGVDLLILDQRMPRTSGLALLAGLKRRAAAASPDGSAPFAGRPVVILISAVLSRELRAEAARLGVAEVLEKPIDTAHLLASVRAALAGVPRSAKPPSPQ